MSPMSMNHTRSSVALRSLCVGLLGCLAASASFAVERSGAPGTDEKSLVSLRRLTETQYRLTIAEVFGADLQIPGRFEHEIRTTGLLAIGAATQTYSPGGLEQYELNARSIAAQAVDQTHRETLLGCNPPAGKFDRKCAARLLSLAGERLFRRPLSSAELAAIMTLAEQETARQKDFTVGIQYALVSLLVSPNFLFRVERSRLRSDGVYELDAISKASRLSFFLWNAPPDAALLKAASSGELDEPAGVARQVARLLASPRLEQGTRAFFADMLGYDAFDRLNLDSTLFPRFDAEVARDAREESLRLIVDLALTQQADYRELFTTRQAFLTRKLGLIYRVPVENATGWSRYEFPPEAGRSGILTRAAFLQMASNPGTTSPTLRGKAIRELFLCQHVPPPPGNVDFSLVQDVKNPVLNTARRRFEAHTKEPMCAGCHKIMDPLGLAFEKFDGVGAARERENGAPIDVSGRLNNKAFASATEFNEVLSSDPALPACLVQREVEYAVGHAVDKGDAEAMVEFKKNFAAGGYKYPELLRQIATSEIFATVRAPKPPAEPVHTAVSSTSQKTKG